MGIEFIFHEHGITMTKRRHITTTLEEFGLIDWNSFPTPMLEGRSLNQIWNNPTMMQNCIEEWWGNLFI